MLAVTEQSMVINYYVLNGVYGYTLRVVYTRKSEYA